MIAKHPIFLSLMLVSSVQGFEFMKGWKMPTYDPHEQAVKERFGDKSKIRSDIVIIVVCCLFDVE